MSQYYSVDEWFQLFENGQTDFYTLLNCARLAKSTACDFLGVSKRQIERYQQGHKIPRAVVIALQFKAGSLRHFGKQWAEFRIIDNQLFIPCAGVRDAVPFDTHYLTKLNSIRYHDEGYQRMIAIRNNTSKEQKLQIDSLQQQVDTLRQRLEHEQTTNFELQQKLHGQNVHSINGRGK